MTVHFATLVTEPINGVEITWEVPYSWRRMVPATYLDPAEGGLDLDGDVRPVTVTWYRWWTGGDCYTIGGIEEGSILDILIVEKYGRPTEDRCWEAAGEHNAARLEDTRY